MELLLAIVGTIVTLVSFIYAIYANQRYATLEDYNREQSWEIYRQSSNVLAFPQEIDKLKIENTNLIKLEAQGERAATELTISTIRNIKRSEKQYDDSIIDKWAKQGKVINDTHIRIFKSFS